MNGFRCKVTVSPISLALFTRGIMVTLTCNTGFEEWWQTVAKAKSCSKVGTIRQAALGPSIVTITHRCGADPKHGRANATPSNCTVGAKLPLYWLQKEKNNVGALHALSLQHRALNP